MAITASDARKRLFPLIKQVNDDREPVEIVSNHGRVYLISAEDYESMAETDYLLRSPAQRRPPSGCRRGGAAGALAHHQVHG